MRLLLGFASIGEFVDDEVYELDLVLAVSLVIEEVGERGLCGCSVEAD